MGRACLSLEMLTAAWVLLIQLRRQLCGDLGFGDADVGVITSSACVYIVAEIRSVDGHGYFRLNQPHIGVVGGRTGVDVTDENTHGRGDHLAKTADFILHIMQGHENMLRIGYAGQIDDVLVRVAADGATADRSSAARYICAFHAVQRIQESKDERVLTGGGSVSALDAVCPGYGKIDIERDAGVGLSRDDTAELNRKR